MRELWHEQQFKMMKEQLAEVRSNLDQKASQCKLDEVEKMVREQSVQQQYDRMSIRKLQKARRKDRRQLQQFMARMASEHGGYASTEDDAKDEISDSEDGSVLTADSASSLLFSAFASSKEALPKSKNVPDESTEKTFCAC